MQFIYIGVLTEPRMSALVRNRGIPVVLFRLFGAVTTGAFFGYFLYRVSVDLGWLIGIRWVYLMWGLLGGFFIGLLEAKVITNNLTREQETLVWQVFPITAGLIVLPLLMIALFSGSSEYLPFLAFSVGSAIPVYLATNGWLLKEFEGEHEVKIQMSPCWFKFWKEPVVTSNAMFSSFIRDVKERQSLFFYYGYSKRFMKKVEETQNIDPSSRKELIDLLGVMNKFRRMMIYFLALFIIVCLSSVLILLTKGFGLFESGFNNLANIVAPVGGVAFFVALIFVAYFRLAFNKAISRELEKIDTNKLSPLLVET